ncbi:hypothetical protein NQ315_012037 [Exocentrus adspersus]|uniref:PiggyBac transposable element-derived protein domain-containing protein n=1 Tax=Exocentrus adspersus TaxID=1586481 RepID=A0AAV8VIP9_9CUCU|nr:hypothetical protein NQ315_012037 [Exocentrus adspersus]
MAEHNIRFVRGFSVHEALTILEEDDFPHPSADEDAMSPDNLPSTQLRAPAEIQVPFQDSDSENDDMSDDILLEAPTEIHIPLQGSDSEDDNIPLARLVSKKSEPVPTIAKVYNWTNDHILYDSNNFDLGQLELEDADESSLVSLFFKFFDENVFDLLIEETNRYAAIKNKNNKPVTVREMKCFVGILILSGYVPYPRRKMFWEQDKDVKDVLVSDALSRDRFDHIMSVFHMADNNNLVPGDKFAKVRPLFTLLNQNFLRYAPKVENHSVDEAMVPYFGRHGCKQFIRGQPIHWGYKLWAFYTKHNLL